MFWYHYHAGSFSRSAVNHESGAKTGLSGLTMGIIMGCALLFMTPLFTDIPQVHILWQLLFFSSFRGIIMEFALLFMNDTIIWTSSFILDTIIWTSTWGTNFVTIICLDLSLGDYPLFHSRALPVCSCENLLSEMHWFDLKFETRLIIESSIFL